jgi:uncharacterized protein (TIGR02147 family)
VSVSLEQGKIEKRTKIACSIQLNSLFNKDLWGRYTPDNTAVMERVAGSRFREYLRGEFKTRSMSNAQYSLRSFARTLDVSPAGLSMILSGKTPVTLSFIEKTAPKLKLKTEQVQDFQLQLLIERTNPVLQSREFEFIDADTFAVIKEWYHYAILNLMRTKDFQQKPAWIARRLGVTLPEVQTAIEKLQKVGLLQIKNGKWIDNSSQFTSHTNNKKFSEAAKHNQIAFFSKARESIEKDDFEKRNHTGSTIALSLSDLEDAKQMITKFRKEFMSRFDKKSGADEVYQISVGLFSLSKLKND